MPGNYSGCDLSSTGFHIRVNLVALLFIKVISDHKNLLQIFTNQSDIKESR